MEQPKFINKNIRRHRSLIEVESLVKSFIVNMTNQAYGLNHKFAFRVEWSKGTGQIIDNNDKVSKNYYHFSFHMIDKTKSMIGKKIDLYDNYYPMEALKTAEKLEEEAYKEFLLNGLRQLYHVSYITHLEELKMEKEIEKDKQTDKVIETLRKSAETPKLFIP
jgi:hypothetical protein